jgi:hypothetical protein
LIFDCFQRGVGAGSAVPCLSRGGSVQDQLFRVCPEPDLPKIRPSCWHTTEETDPITVPKAAMERFPSISFHRQLYLAKHCIFLNRAAVLSTENQEISRKNNSGVVKNLRPPLGMRHRETRGDLVIVGVRGRRQSPRTGSRRRLVFDLDRNDGERCGIQRGGGVASRVRPLFTWGPICQKSCRLVGARARILE